jgi:hydrogenase maturation protease
MIEERKAERCVESCGAYLILGIGSPHGDDRAGWAVIEHLEQQTVKPCAASLQLRKAAVPHDILDWLDRDTKTHIIDACSSVDASVCRYEIIQDEVGELCIFSTDAQGRTKINVAFDGLRSGSSHQFDLLSTLQLAAALRNLPLAMVLWTIPIVQADKNADLNVTTRGHVADCAIRIRRELFNA